MEKAGGAEESQMRDSVLQSLGLDDDAEKTNAAGAHLILEEEDANDGKPKANDKAKEEDDGYIEMESVCFCGALNCEDESHKAKATSATTSTTIASATTSDCCATGSCTAGLQVEKARKKDPPPPPPASKAAPCCGDKNCSESSAAPASTDSCCGEMDCSSGSGSERRTTSPPAAKKPKVSCCDDDKAICTCGNLECDGVHDENKEATAAAAVTTATTKASAEEEGNCCGTSKCVCGKLNCEEEEIHAKQFAAKSTTTTTPAVTKKKQPYKVKMNIHQRWNGLFEKLKAFHAQHNTWLVPRTHDDKSLERWVNRQRSSYHRGQLKPKRKAALEAIGFDWGQPPKHKGDTWITTKPWHERFEQLMEFKEWHGHCKVPTKYEEDPSLNRWVWKQQRDYAKGKLTKEQIRCLKSLGVTWIPASGGKDGSAKKRKRNSDTDMGGESFDNDDNMEQDDEDNNEGEESGESSGNEGQSIHIPIIKSSWDIQFDELAKFLQECGHTNVTTKHDHKLGTWAQRQRTHYRQKNLHPERIKKLESIGFQWRAAHANFVPRTWKDQYYMLKKFKEEHKHVNVPSDYSADKLLARWVQHQRRDKSNGSLAPERIAQLDALGFEWNGPGAGLAANNNAYTQRNQGSGKNLTPQQQLAMAQQKALARQYEDLTQQQAIATQRQAMQQQQDAYTAMTAHQQYAFAQTRRQTMGTGRLTEAEEARRALESISEAAEAKRAVEWMKLQQQQHAAFLSTVSPWPPGWGWNTRGEMVWCGGGVPPTSPAAAAAVAAAAKTAEGATATTEASAAAEGTPKATTVDATVTATGGAQTEATAATKETTDKAPIPAAAEDATTTTTTKPEAAERIKELELENAELKEANIKLKQEKLELLQENTSLKTTVEESRQAYMKEKKTLEEQVQEHASQLKQQANQTQSQGQQMDQLMKQVLEMKNLMDSRRKESEDTKGE